MLIVLCGSVVPLILPETNLVSVINRLACLKKSIVSVSCIFRGNMTHNCLVHNRDNLLKVGIKRHIYLTLMFSSRRPCNLCLPQML